VSTTTTVQTYAIDASHTNAEFVVRHMMIAKVRGRFAALAGTIEVPEGSDVPSSIQATLEVDSITTSEAQRDGHLKSPDFFDAPTFPQMTFSSTRITPNGDAISVEGDLTIRGTTRPVTLAATFEGRTTDPWGNRRIGYEAHAKISRKDFGLTWNQALEAGGVAVGDEVKIELAIEAVAQS